MPTEYAITKLRARVSVSMTRGVVGWTIYDQNGRVVWVRSTVLTTPSLLKLLYGS